jgi:hypothetical protein
VADRRKVPCSADCLLAAASETFGSFTTGKAADTTAPVFAGSHEKSVGVYRDGGCGGRGYDVWLSWSAAKDEGSGDVRYNVYRRNGTGEPELMSSLTPLNRFDMFAICERSPPNKVAGTYFVHAVDGAGNENTSIATFDVADPCLQARPPLGDAAEPPLTGGCHFAGGSATHARAPLVLMPLIFAWAHWRRRLRRSLPASPLA